MHKSKSCLCTQCSPANPLRSNTHTLDPYPESMYRSQYMLNFKAKPTRQASPFKIANKLLPQDSIDLKSTYQTEYLHHNTRPSSHDPCKTRSASVPQITYKNTTTYSEFFPKHSAEKFPVMTGFAIDHRKKNLKVSKKTVYNEDFKEMKGSFVKIENPNIKLSHSAQAEFDYPRVSTVQREYRDLSKYIEKNPRFKPYEFSFKMKSCNAQYLTTHKREFVVQETTPALQNFELCLKKSQASKSILK